MPAISSEVAIGRRMKVSEIFIADYCAVLTAVRVL
jgi:hypothetical protein